MPTGKPLTKAAIAAHPETAKLLAALQEGFGDDLLAAILHGSLARGEAGPESDCDLAVITPCQGEWLSRNHRFQHLMDWERRGLRWDGHAVDVWIQPLAQPGEWSNMWANLLTEGVVFYERDHALAEYSRCVRDWVRDGVLVRYQHAPSDAPYWGIARDAITTAGTMPVFRPERVRALLHKAQRAIVYLDAACSRDEWDGMVRFAGEAVEMSLKAVFQSVDIVPRSYNLKKDLITHMNKLPSAVISQVAHLGEVSATLAKKYAQAAYGEETEGPEEIIDEKFARWASDQARSVLALAETHAAPRGSESDHGLPL